MKLSTFLSKKKTVNIRDILYFFYKKQIINIDRDIILKNNKKELIEHLSSYFKNNVINMTDSMKNINNYFLQDNDSLIKEINEKNGIKILSNNKIIKYDLIDIIYDNNLCKLDLLIKDKKILKDLIYKNLNIKVNNVYNYIHELSLILNIKIDHNMRFNLMFPFDSSFNQEKYDSFIISENIWKTIDLTSINDYLIHILNINDLKTLCNNYNIKYSDNVIKKKQIIDNLMNIFNKLKITKTSELINFIKKPIIENTEINNDFSIINMKYNSKIDKIIHLSDIHIRRKDRFQEYSMVFNNLYNTIKNLNIDFYNCIIVITGDIFHYKTSQKPESISLFIDFINNLLTLHPVISILGNHDITNNSMDILTPFKSIFSDNYYFLKDNGIYNFNNINFVCNSVLNDNIIKVPKHNNDKTWISLYHGMVHNDSILKFENSIHYNSFGSFDYLLLGDIHKKSYLTDFCAYPGSLIQQNCKEDLNNHGFILWNINEKTNEYFNIKNLYCFLKINHIDGNFYYNNQIINDDILNDKKYLNISCINQTDMSFNDIKNKLYNSSFVKDKEILKFDIINDYESYMIDLKEDNNTDSFEFKKLASQIIKNPDEILLDKLSKLHKQNIIKLKNNNIESYSWNIHTLEFQNLFNFYNDINIINFKKNTGFNRIFGNNFIGKSSIIKIIKWVLYGDNIISNKRIYHQGINKVNDCFGKIILEINNELYHIKRFLKIDNKNKITHFFEIKHNNKIINKKIEELIGLQKNFINISSINNIDTGIIDDSDLLSTFENIFNISYYSEISINITNDIKNLKNDIKSLKKEIDFFDSDIINHDFNNEVDKLNTQNDEFSNIRNKNDFKIETYTTKIKKLFNKINNINIHDIQEVSNKQNELSILFDKFNKVISLNECIELLNNLKFEYIDSDFSYNKDVQKKLYTKFENFDIKNIKIQKEKLLKQISPINEKNIDIDDINNKISKYEGLYNKYVEKKKKYININMNIDKQIFNNFNNNRISILECINNNLDLNNLKDIIKFNINNDNYGILNHINNDMDIDKINSNIDSYNNKILKYTNLKNEFLNNNDIKKNNLIIQKQIDNIDIILNEYKTFNNYKKYDNNNSFNLLKEIKLLLTNQDNFNNYNKLIKENQENIIKKQKYTTLYEDFINKKENLETKNSELKNNIINNKWKIKDLNDKLNKQIKLIKLKSQLSEFNEKLSLYNQYKKLISSKGIPSIILNNKIPIFVKEINKLLNVYTNFNIDIQINGNGNMKKINIYQYKKLSKKLISIKDCSSYEKIILNIIFRIVIKNICKLKHSNIIMIDEVLSSISIQNYNKLENLFKLLLNNFKNIIIISHNESIKDILNNYKGNDIIIKDNKLL